jgi:hypothetical protein
VRVGKGSARGKRNGKAIALLRCRKRRPPGRAAREVRPASR